MEGYHSYASPPNSTRSQGVQILASDKFQQVQAIMTNAWSPTLIAIKVKISENQKLIVVNQYTDGLNIKRCDENLETLVQSVKQLYGNIPILIGGDFNRKSD